MKIQYVACCLFAFYFFFAGCEILAADAPISVVKIAADAQSALIKDENGKLKVIHAGDTVGSYGTIQAISDGRLLIEGKQGEVVIITIQNGKQHTQRIRKSVLPVQKGAVLTAPLQGAEGAGGAALHLKENGEGVKK